VDTIRKKKKEKRQKKREEQKRRSTTKENRERHLYQPAFDSYISCAISMSRGLRSDNIKNYIT